jgi:hypothetical protein
MPSDTRTARALDALIEHRTRYRSAVSAAHDQMAAYLAAHRARTHGHAQTVARELGRFAAGRIDAERFSSVFAAAHVLTPETAERVERLVGVLAELLAEGDELFTCDVPPGGDLAGEVDRALARAGRVFGAVLAFQALKTGVHRPERHDADVDAFPFARWNRSERLLGFPLVVEVDGADAHGDALAAFADGRMAIVLVIRGASSPAPLVRLITPGTLVVQTSDVAELSRLSSSDAPAVAALVPATAACFVHDPRAGGALQSRLRVAQLPAAIPSQPLGGRSAWQQAEELAQLRSLQALASVEPVLASAAAPASAPAGRSNGQAAPVDEPSVDRLAGWLLAEAGLGVGAAAGGGGR